MTTVETLATPLQELFGRGADQLARDCRFIQRQRVFSGSSFLRTCVFTWMRHPDATLEQLTATAASLGLDLAAQSLDERLDLPAAEFFRLVLQRCLARAFAPQPRALPLLERFAGVYLDDCTHLSLPAELAALFAGCGGSTAPAGVASMKILLRWEVCSAQLVALPPRSARAGDTTLAEELPLPPPGSLRLADVAFFKLQALYDLDAAGVFFLSKVKQGTTLRILGEPITDLAGWLNGRGKGRVDRRVVLGGKGKKAISCRLIAWRLDEATAAKRRARLVKDGVDKGYTPSAEALALCDWLVLVSNVPRQKLSLLEVAAVYRVRWQVELIFKSWKSDSKIDEWRTKRPGRILAEIYGKLIAAVVQTWVSLLSWTEGPIKSVRRVLKGLKDVVVKALERLVEDGVAGLVACLRRALPGLRRLGRLPRRRKAKGTYQTLEDLCHHPPASQPADADLDPLS
jgi:Transposase DDE domain